MSDPQQPAAAIQRADIQGLRAVAVGLVVADHAGVDLFGSGFVGVDVFFVLSGFLITQILVRELGRTGTVSLRDFYARRARRILPAAALTLAVVLVWAAFFRGAATTGDSIVDAWWAAAFAANIHLALDATDYFASGASPSPFQHYWSLAVEEQFYLAWPAALLGAGWLARRTGLARPLLLKRVFTGLVGLCAASLAWSVWASATSPQTAYFSSFTRAWELGAGAVLAVVGARHGWSWVSDRLALTLTWLGGLGLLASGVALPDGVPFPGAIALLPVLSTAALLVAGGPRGARGPGRLLETRPFTWIGDISYSLYLWHWPVLLWGGDLVAGHGVSARLVAPLLVAATIVLAWLSTRFVERPFRHGVRWRRPAFALALWPAALLVVALGAGAAHLQVARDEQARVAASQSFDPSSLPAQLQRPRTGDAVHDALAESLERADAKAPIPFPLTPELGSLRADFGFSMRGCSALPDQSTQKICPVGDVDATRTVIVYGDSHAHMWLPAMDRLGREQHFKVLPFIKLGCSPWAVRQSYSHGGSDYDACYRFRDWATQRILATPADLVLVGGRSYPDDILIGAPETSATWQRAAEESLRSLTGGDAKVAVLADGTQLPRRPGNCLEDDSATMADCTFPVDPRVSTANAGVRRAARATGATWVDTLSLACLDGRCPVAAAHHVLYRDRQHLTATWTRFAAPALGRMLPLG